MKTINRNSAIAVALFLYLWTVQTASAFYDPNLQRWVNRDPIQESGGKNLYQFVSNEPVQKGDAWGLRMIIVPGGPPSFPSDVACAADRLSDSTVGEQLLDMLADKDIFLTPSRNDTSTGVDVRLSANDPNFIPAPFYERHPNEVPQVPITDPWAGPAIVLGHELGHALLNLDDPENVLEVENPIRSALGIPGRPCYHGVPLESDEPPTCPCQ